MTTEAGVRSATRSDRESLGEGGASARKKAVARRRLRVRLTTGAFAALFVAAAVVAAWPKALAVEEAAVKRSTLEVTVDEAGKTRVRDRYVVYAPLAGNLARIELRVGDSVAAGAPLARLSPASPALLDPRARAEAGARVQAAEAAEAQANAQVARAEAASAHAAEERQRTRHLVSAGALSEDQLRNAELDDELRAKDLTAARFGALAALNDVGVARAALRRYGDQAGGRDPFVIASPISGRVLRVDQQSASVVSPGTALIEVGDPTSLEVVVDVLTADAVRIPPNAHVRLERWGGGVPLRAHVRVVEPSGFTKISALGVEEQRASVVIDIDDPQEVWARLGDGYRAEARIVTWQGDVLSVPAGATFRAGDAWAVFVDDGGRARLRAVQLGQRGEADIQVISGLASGERVVIHPSSAVADGARIRSL